MGASLRSSLSDKTRESGKHRGRRARIQRSTCCLQCPLHHRELSCMRAEGAGDAGTLAGSFPWTLPLQCPYTQIRRRRAPAGYLVTNWRSVLYMVGATGFELVKAPGLAADNPETNCGHYGANHCRKSSCAGHSGDTAGHAEDTLASSPCCPYVAHSDLQKLADAWDALPLQVRQAILLMADAAIASLHSSIFQS
jgi:hypothetical protein